MPVTVEQLSRMSPDDVDQVFRRGEVGDIPAGDATGTAIIWPGSPAEPLLQRVVRDVAWQGKVLDAQTQDLKNKILPVGLRAIAADVYTGRSWYDGADCIVLDYSKRSLLAKWVRDEIRLVGPGLYLGLVYLGRTRLIYFTLQFAV